MKRVKIAELKDHLSEHLRLVERTGQIVEVTDRDRPIARIVPVPLLTPPEPLQLRPPKRPFAEIRDRVYPPVDLGGRSILDFLEEERGDR